MNEQALTHSRPQETLDLVDFMFLVAGFTRLLLRTCLKPRPEMTSTEANHPRSSKEELGDTIQASMASACPVSAAALSLVA